MFTGAKNWVILSATLFYVEDYTLPNLRHMWFKYLAVHLQVHFCLFALHFKNMFHENPIDFWTAYLGKRTYVML